VKNTSVKLLRVYSNMSWWHPLRRKVSWQRCSFGGYESQRVFFRNNFRSKSYI